MQKERVTTLSAKFGFQDEDLKKSKHDEIMMWLDDRAEEIIIPMYSEYRQRDIDDLGLSGEAIGYLGYPPPREPPSGFIKTWEYPITTDKNFVVGFVDLRVWFYAYLPYVGDMEDEEGRTVKGWACHRSPQAIHFEVKTEIPSMGELIRQVRLYQQYNSEDRISYFVVAPQISEQQALLLKKQGIGYVEYK